MKIAIILLVLFAAMVCYACCKVSGSITRKEEQQDPCDTCLRWGECNGVDEECPVRRDKK